jgi:hypothetical protein
MAINHWTTSSLDKIFPESVRPVNATTAIELWAARNETEDAQVAIQVPADRRVDRAAFSFSRLAGPRGHEIPKENLSAFWEWYVWVHANPPANTDPSTYLRKAPAFFPDAFLEDPEPGLRGGVTQPLWVSVQVPGDAPAGDYRGILEIALSFRDGKVEKFKVDLKVHVWPFALPEKPSMHHTEWFHAGILADYYHVPEWSDAHWGWIARIARDMGRHRQDMILTDFPTLVGVTGREDGTLTFDFSRLDRWLDLFQAAGVCWVEGGHVAGRTGGWESPIMLHRWRPRDEHGKPIDTSRKKMSEARFTRYTERLLKAVHAHLKERGLAGRYVQHVADEPIPANMASWKAIASQVGKWLPGVPRIDAIETPGLEGYCEMQVPQIQMVKGPSRLTSPNELWSYVCLFPQTIYPNRFLDYPSIRNRMIFWLSYSLNLKGFLHWGHNFWKMWSGVPVNVPISPWTDLTGGSLYNTDTQPLPAGDTHIVYPGRDSICSSIRWEVIRKGMEDYELLTMLDRAVRRPARRSAPAIKAGRALLDFVRNTVAPLPGTHTRNDAILLNARREAGDILSMLLK